LFAWLHAQAPLLTLAHAAYLVCGAVLLQCAVAGLRTLAGANPQQLAAEETRAEAARRLAAAAAAKLPPVPRPPPLGPAFSSDAGMPLIGYTSAEIEAALVLRRRVKNMRQQEVMANVGLSNLKQPVIRAKVGAMKEARAGAPSVAGTAVAEPAVAAVEAAAEPADAAVAAGAVATVEVAAPTAAPPKEKEKDKQQVELQMRKKT
jgi:hypothetical protein